jgi:hypothetical protein
MAVTTLDESRAERAYRQLVRAIESDDEIEMRDETLILAAHYAADCGQILTARRALAEIIERGERERWAA